MINHRIGFFFPLPVIIIGSIISFVGVTSVFQATIFGVFLVPVGLFFVLSSYGSQIDPENHLYRTYVNFIGFKRGSWSSLNDLPFITVLKSRRGMAFYSQTNRSTSLIDDSFEVYLLNESHRMKFLIQKFETNELAAKYAEELSKQIDKEKVRYNPVVSEKTRLRRKSR